MYTQNLVVSHRGLRPSLARHACETPTLALPALYACCWCLSGCGCCFSSPYHSHLCSSRSRARVYACSSSLVFASAPLSSDSRLLSQWLSSSLQHLAALECIAAAGAVAPLSTLLTLTCCCNRGAVLQSIQCQDSSSLPSCARDSGLLTCKYQKRGLHLIYSCIRGWTSGQRWTDRSCRIVNANRGGRSERLAVGPPMNGGSKKPCM